MSTQTVANKLKCSQGTIINRLRELNIKARSKAEMRIVYKKKSFNDNDIKKSYLIGFRLGDLNVYRPHKNSKIYVVRCHTTIKEQVNLIRDLFKKFGGVKIASSKHNGFTINCFLNESFDFLYPKHIPKWIFRKKKQTLAFTAGYIDAEGSFGLNQGRGRFKIDSYDYDILKNINRFLNRKKIKTKFYRIGKVGFNWKNHLKLNKELWRLNVNEADSLEKLARLVIPVLRHKKRIKDAVIVLNNINVRRKKGTI